MKEIIEGGMALAVLSTLADFVPYLTPLHLQCMCFTLMFSFFIIESWQKAIQ